MIRENRKNRFVRSLTIAPIARRDVPPGRSDLSGQLHKYGYRRLLILILILILIEVLSARPDAQKLFD